MIAACTRRMSAILQNAAGDASHTATRHELRNNQGLSLVLESSTGMQQGGAAHLLYDILQGLQVCKIQRQQRPCDNNDSGKFGNPVAAAAAAAASSSSSSSKQQQPQAAAAQQPPPGSGG